VNATGLQEKLWWLDLPAVWGFYVLFWRMFDRLLWNWPLLRVIGLVKVPDLGGRWVGHGLSSYKDAAGRPTEYGITITITQRWTACLVHTETDASWSDSLIGAILLGNGRPPALSYEYKNQPRAHAGSTMHAHPGMTRLEMADATHLVGEYYSGRDRQTYGTLTLTRR
jgi:hypothetical protein